MVESSQDENGGTFHFVSRSQRLSETVVHGVAYVKGVDPTDLEPLANFIDPSALDVIFARTQSGNVEFEMDDVDVCVYASGEVEVTRQDEAATFQSLVPDELKDQSNVLLLADPHEGERCSELLFPAQTEKVSVLGVTLDQSPAHRLDLWEAYLGTLPRNISILTIGGFTRSSGNSTRQHVATPSPITIETIQTPDDLTALETTTRNLLSAGVDADIYRAACFHSVTALLRVTDEELVLDCLQRLTGLMEDAGVHAHYHLDPTVHSDTTVRTVSKLFDTIVRVDDAGKWTIES